MHRRTIAIALLLASIPGWTQPSIQQDHVERNSPPEQEFGPLLRRDLLAYFKASGVSAATAVEYRLLRDSPTQSGVSYPKYYAWIQVKAGDKRVLDGAARLAAIGRERFEVTDFVAKPLANGNAAVLEGIFPGALVPDILRLAAE